MAMAYLPVKVFKIESLKYRQQRYDLEFVKTSSSIYKKSWPKWDLNPQLFACNAGILANHWTNTAHTNFGIVVLLTPV